LYSYYEGYRAKGVEVLFLYAAVDEFVMNSLNEYRQFPLRSIESGDDLEALPDRKDTKKTDDDKADAASADVAPLSDVNNTHTRTYA
jgi:molecular chaperone HtpG